MKTVLPAKLFLDLRFQPVFQFGDCAKIDQLDKGRDARKTGRG
jgi:hypothetical protein